MRSQILFVAALLSTTTFAQKTASNLATAPTDRASTQKIDLENIKVIANTGEPGSFDINWDGSRSHQVAVVMDRDFRDAIQGNMDRETLERLNGETR
ncbi:MAG: hypothetical protein AAB214_05520 [Fibrobacterota bacterium]